MVEDMGYNKKVGYQTFLYPKLAVMRHLMMWYTSGVLVCSSRHTFCSSAAVRLCPFITCLLFFSNFSHIWHRRLIDKLPKLDDTSGEAEECVGEAKSMTTKIKDSVKKMRCRLPFWFALCGLTQPVSVFLHFSILQMKEWTSVKFSSLKQKNQTRAPLQVPFTRCIPLTTPTLSAGKFPSAFWFSSTAKLT